MSDLINGRTPEEILFNIRECAYGACLSECPYDSSDECTEDLLKDAFALIERLESERDAALAKVPKWISIEERLPEEDGKYIVRTEKNSVYSTKYRTGHGRGGFGCDINTHITHWMPLPEPPKEDE